MGRTVRIHTQICVLALVALAWSGCRSGPETNSSDTGSGSRQPTATASSSFAKAQDKEKTGATVQGFSRMSWFEEACLEYQWLIDHYPTHPLGDKCRTRIGELREQIERLKHWKHLWDDFEMQSRVMQNRPAYLDQARRAAENLGKSPFLFVRRLAIERLGKVIAAAKRTVQADLERLERKFRPLADNGQWREAWAAFGSFDPDHAKRFPEAGATVDGWKKEIDRHIVDAARAAVKEIRLRFDDGDPLGALVAFAPAIERFLGTSGEAVLSREAKALRDAFRDALRKDRALAEGYLPPKATDPPAIRSGTPGSSLPDEARRDRATEILERPFAPEIPKPETLYQTLEYPMVEADRFYFIAVEMEQKALPGCARAGDYLAIARRMYKRLEEIYLYLLEMNKGPSDPIETRIDKTRKALKACGLLEAALDE